MELTLLSGKMFPENGRKLESVENKIKKYFIQSLVFNKTIIPPTFVGYELMVADSVLISNVRSWNNFFNIFSINLIKPKQKQRQGAMGFGYPILTFELKYSQPILENIRQKEAQKLFGQHLKNFVKFYY